MTYNTTEGEDVTIAIDKTTDKVLGQVVWTIAPLADQYAGSMREPAPIRILTSDGYSDVPRASVRLEETND